MGWLRIFRLMRCLEALMGRTLTNRKVSRHALLSYPQVRRVMEELEMAELVVRKEGEIIGRGRPLILWEITLKGRNMVRAWRSA